MQHFKIVITVAAEEDNGTAGKIVRAAINREMGRLVGEKHIRAAKVSSKIVLDGVVEL